MLFWVGICCAQDLTIHINKKGKVGFVDKNGKEVVKCEYESVTPFVNDVSIVTKGGKKGLINTSGKIVLPVKYTQINKWNSSLYLVNDNKKLGLVDKMGKTVLPIKYSQISRPNQYGLSLLGLGGKATKTKDGKNTYMMNAKYGIINNRGSIVIEPKYKGLYEFANDTKNIFPFYEGKRLKYSDHFVNDTLFTDCQYLGFSKNLFSELKSGILDKNGKEILKAGLYDYVMLPQNGMIRFYIAKKKTTECGYYNLKTSKSFIATTFNAPIAEMKYWSHGDFVGSLAPVNGESWSFIDNTGKTLRKNYKAVKHSLVANVWAAQNTTGKWDVFDENNNNISSLSDYDNITLPVNGNVREIFSVKKGNLCGAISRTGETIIPFEYENVGYNVFDVVAVQREGKWGAVSSNNEPLFDAKYLNYLLPEEKNTRHFWVMKADSLYYHLDLDNNNEATVGYKKVTNFKNGVAFVIPQSIAVADTPRNRALLFKPNTKLSTIKEQKFSEAISLFGYIMNTDNKMVFSLPVTALYVEKVLGELKKYTQPIGMTEQKNIILEVTKENRSYDLKSVISDEDWNY